MLQKDTDHGVEQQEEERRERDEVGHGDKRATVRAVRHAAWQARAGNGCADQSIPCGWHCKSCMTPFHDSPVDARKRVSNASGGERKLASSVSSPSGLSATPWNICTPSTAYTEEET